MGALHSTKLQHGRFADQGTYLSQNEVTLPANLPCGNAI